MGLYFIIRVALILAVLCGVAYLLGTLVGKWIWGGAKRRAEEIENENRKLREESEALRAPAFRESIPEL